MNLVFRWRASLIIFVYAGYTIQANKIIGALRTLPKAAGAAS
jgi:hypothetical protein